MSATAQHEAAQRFVSTIGDAGVEDLLAPIMSCPEVGALAELLRAYDRPGAAKEWESEHRRGCTLEEGRPEITCPAG